MLVDLHRVAYIINSCMVVAAGNLEENRNFSTKEKINIDLMQLSLNLAEELLLSKTVPQKVE